MASENLAQKAVANVGDQNQAQSAMEPPSGVTGQGTTNSPYDGGNAPENIPRPGVEPPSGQTGNGTTSDPYDGGNAPENASNIPEGQIEHSAPTGHPEHTGSGAPQNGTNIEEAQAATATGQKNQAPADKFEETTGAATEGDNFGALTGRDAKRKISEQRDVSPGTLPDGSHAKSAADRGELYEPSKISKFKTKMGFGKK